MSTIDAPPTWKTTDETRAATELTWIDDYAAQLDAELPHRAAARFMPGGDVLAALAPIANLEAHGWQLDTAERRALDHGGPWPDHTHEDLDPAPPLQTLRTWTEPLRRHLGAETDRPTITTETALLRRHLTALASHDRFPRLLADLRRVRRHLENLLHAGVRADRSQVPCWDPDCEHHPRLVRTYANDPRDDGYMCPACHRHYDRDQYARACWQTFSHQSADRWVPLADACSLLPQPERTTRAWVESGRVTHTCELRTRRVLVWWPDLWALWLNPPRRGRPPREAAA